MNLGQLDIHGHFGPPVSRPQDRMALLKMAHANCFLVSETWSWSIEDSLASMDAAGVQMQMLSNIPPTIDQLRASNDYGAEVVKKSPDRFGLLCALPTEDANACMFEISRAEHELGADGFAVTAERKGVSLGNPSLDPVWAKLNSMPGGVTVFCHPNANAAPRDGRPAPLIEVAFETCRVAIDMVYRRVFQRFPNINFVFAHCGGALPVLSGRLELLGAEPWVPNPQNVSGEGIHEQLKGLYVDTAATASTGLEPAIKMVGADHVLYGSDCGVPCSTNRTMEMNNHAVASIEQRMGLKTGFFGANAWVLFPLAAQRVIGQRKS